MTHPAVAGATTYEIHQCKAGNQCQRYGQAYNIRSLPITVKLSSTEQASYTFKVRSSNSCGWGAWSNAIPVTMTTGPRPMCLTATSDKCDA